MTLSPLRLVVVLLLSCLVAGCSVLEPRPDPTQYFVLRPVERNTDAATAKLTVGLGPISLPSYLDRPQMVRRDGSNRVRVAEYERWAEPLRSAVPRVLAQDIENRERIGRVANYPWPPGGVDFGVQVDITHFEVDASGVAELAAHWVVRRGKDTVLWHESTIVKQSAGGDTEAAVAAMSAALDDLAGEIAEGVHSIHAAR